jgi:DNA-binding XRE family transcriptional regulator
VPPRSSADLGIEPLEFVIDLRDIAPKWRFVGIAKRRIVLSSAVRWPSIVQPSLPRAQFGVPFVHLWRSSQDRKAFCLQPDAFWRNLDDNDAQIGVLFDRPNDFIDDRAANPADEDAVTPISRVEHLNRTVAPLMGRARNVLGLTQKSLGEALDASQRTAHRWETGKATPTVSTIRHLAQLVFPHDPALATELAGAASATLADLGLVRPAAHPPAPSLPQPAPPPPPAPPPLPVRLVVQAVVCVAADELVAAPSTVRRALQAAFRCARELGLSVEDVEKALGPEPQEKAAAARTARTPARRSR